MEMERARTAPTLADKTVLVTGASGFIGGSMCRRLAGNGAEVHAVSRTACEDLPAGVRSWQVDLGDSDRVGRLFREVKPAVVFHLAGTCRARVNASRSCRRSRAISRRP